MDKNSRKNEIIRNLIPYDMVIPLITTLIMNTLAYNGSRLITTGMHHYNLSNAFDDHIPVVPWTVTIYLGCYIFWIVNYIIGCRQEKKTAYRFLAADFFAKIVCMICFVLFPTTNTRPDITGMSVWDEVLRFVYRVDAADNLLPSIHCLTSWLCYIAVRRNDKIPRWYKNSSLVIAVLICVSTLTTKQHVIWDVAAGVMLAEISYQLTDITGAGEKYSGVMSAITAKCVEKRRKQSHE
ncbi:MAG: phosphatase PAP2 family protein [Agathobacter sp.]|nr:phosphatase PAP2 family protein [Agathobacter sp.]